jgi:hypothetical protein
MVLLVVLIAASWAFGTSWLDGLLMGPVTWVLNLYLGLADSIAALIH